MSKRSSDLEDSVYVDSKIQKQEILGTNIQQIPNEMIMKIFSNLNNHKDIKSLMSVSKSFRNLVFETSQCMMKIKIVFKNKIKQDEISQFLTEKGKYFKTLVIQKNPKDSKTNDPELVPFILNQTPNIEEFIHDYDGKKLFLICDEIVKHPFNLPHLRRFTLAGDFWENFITNSRNLNKLKSLKLTRFDSKFNEILTSIICEQENLKEFCVEYLKAWSAQPFPSRDISGKIKFKLTKFEYYLLGFRDSGEKNDNLFKFLEVHAETIQELHLRDNLMMEFYEIIYGKCKNLKKLTLLPFNDLPFGFDVHSHWNLNNLEYFEIHRVELVIFNLIKNNFPNVKTLRCGRFINVNGTFEQLETLDVDILHPIKNIKFPNLKNLTVRSVDDSYETIVQNTPNLVNFDIEMVVYDESIFQILKNLKFLKKLKVFKASKKFKIQNIFISTVAKTVKLSPFFRTNDRFCLILNTDFADFEIIYSEEELKIESGEEEFLTDEDELLTDEDSH